MASEIRAEQRLARHVPPGHRLTGALAFFLPILLLPGGVVAQQVQCDPRIVEIAQAADHGYRLRGDRCEGTFRPEVSSPTLWVAAFYDTFEDFWPTSDGELLLRWESPVDTRVFVQAQSVRRQEYYRMDTQLDGGSTSYAWSTALLAARELGRSDIGVRAWTPGPDGREVLYLPLHVGDAVRESGTGQYTLTLVPNVRLADVLITLAPVDSVGDLPTDGFLRRNDSLGQPLYVTQQPIPITLEGLTDRGVHLVEITGIMATDEALPPKRVWFFHPGD